MNPTMTSTGYAKAVIVRLHVRSGMKIKEVVMSFKDTAHDIECFFLKDGRYFAIHNAQKQIYIITNETITYTNDQQLEHMSTELGMWKWTCNGIMLAPVKSRMGIFDPYIASQATEEFKRSMAGELETIMLS